MHDSYSEILLTESINSKKGINQRNFKLKHNAMPLPYIKFIEIYKMVAYLCVKDKTGYNSFNRTQSYRNTKQKIKQQIPRTFRNKLEVFTESMACKW